MKVTPILICRTKYVDYNDPVFCAPTDISNSITKSLHDIIIKGNNLKYANECKVLISDNQHVIIGKVLYVRQLDTQFDISLDKEKDGRSAWGFIGGVLQRKEYVERKQILDLPESYYIKAYKECLYDEHWCEKKFCGPYIYGAFDIDMEVLPDLDSTLLISSEVPIFSSSMNDSLFAYAAKQTIKGKAVAFCSNEEFNAAEAITKGALTYATVSEGNLREQVESYKRTIVERERVKRNVNNSDDRTCVKNREQHVKESYFYQELFALCQKYGYELKILPDKCEVCGYFVFKGANNKNKKDNSFKKTCSSISEKIKNIF